MPISVASPPSARGLAVPLRALVRAALALEGRVAGDVDVLLTDDRALRELNRRWRGLDRATDVLSFAREDGPPGRRVSGDLAISLDRVDEQARRYRVTRGRELARLVIHGALHLAGLDHDHAAERRRMRAAENRALRAARGEVARLDRAMARNDGRTRSRAS
jgi:probable rRNA maturation factor